MYKNKFTGHVISEADYYKLPWQKRQEFERVYNEDRITHHYNEESDDFLIGAAVGAAIGMVMDSFFGDDTSSIDNTPDTTSDFEFGGGESGGSGAGGDW